MKVLSKPELNGNILLLELLQIMDNIVLTENPEGQYQEEPPEQESNASPDQLEQSHKRKKKDKMLDLSKLDEKSVKIMVMLMLYLLEQNMNCEDFFGEVIYQQNVKSKTKQQTLDIINSNDFFRVLQEKGIRSKAKEHPNLKKLLQLSPNFPDLLMVKNIRDMLEQMAENEAFMEAIRKDVMAGDEEAELEAERLAKEQAIEEEISRIREGVDEDSDNEQAEAP